MPTSKAKAICILGPTAAGKTKIGVELAAEFNGEIISADSRQVYKYLDICTGKDKNEYVISKPRFQNPNKAPRKKFQKIPYHLIDILEPNEKISVANFQERAYEAMHAVIKREKLPVVVGGSPFYVYSIVDGLRFPEIETDEKLRKELSKKTVNELQEILMKIDPKAYSTIDINNPRRLQRAIEVCISSGEEFEKSKPTPSPKFDFLILGITFPNEVLKLRIKKRLKQRLGEGMVEEVKNVVDKNLASWKDLEEMGLEPRFISFYLQGKIDKKEMEDLLLKNIYQFAKRQMTWFRKDERIHWIENYKEAESLVKEFL